MIDASNLLSDFSVGTDNFGDGDYIAIPHAIYQNERPRNDYLYLITLV